MLTKTTFSILAMFNIYSSGLAWNVRSVWMFVAGFLCFSVCSGISLRRKLDFSAKKNEFPFCRLWISSGNTAGRQSNKLLSNKKRDGITF